MGRTDAGSVDRTLGNSPAHDADRFIREGAPNFLTPGSLVYLPLLGDRYWLCVTGVGVESFTGYLDQYPAPDAAPHGTRLGGRIGEILAWIPAEV